MADLASKLIEKFGPKLDTIELNSLKQASFLESIYNLTVISDIEQAKQISLLTDMTSLLGSILKSDEELAERLRRQQAYGQFEEPSTTTEAPTDTDTAQAPQLSDMGLGSLLTAAALTPFLFSFAKGFLEEVTDGILEVTAGGIAGVISMLQGRYNAFIGAIVSPVVRIFDFVTDSFKGLGNLNKTLSNSFANIRAAFTAGLEGSQAILRSVNGTFRSATLFDDVIRGVGVALSPVINIVSKIGGFLAGVGKTAADIFSKIPGVSLLTGFIRRIAWPFTMVMGLYDGIMAFRDQEGSMIEKILAGVGGFLGEIVGAPLDLIRGAVAWILDKLGFDKASEFLQSFNIEEKINEIFGGIYDTVSAAVDSIKEFFAWTGDIIVDGWDGLGSLVTNIFNNIRNWFNEKLQWAGDGITEGSDFLVSLLNETIESVKTWFTNAFDFLPSIDEIKAVLTALLPSWMRPEGAEEARRKLQESIAEQRRYISEGDMRNWYGRRREDVIAELESELAALPQLRRGGILNMPSTGGLAMLHGQEAVIPLDSPEAMSTLAKKTAAIAQESTAMSAAPAPVIIRGGNTAAPVTNNVNNSQNTVVNKTVDPIRRLNHMPM